MLLIPVNVEEMVRPFPIWEKRVLRERQGQLPAFNRARALAGFLEDRLEYAINMVATSKRHVLPMRPQRAEETDMIVGVPVAGMPGSCHHR
jgi:hypothetical protein